MLRKFKYSNGERLAQPSTMLQGTDTAARLNCACNPYRSQTGNPCEIR